MADCKGPIDTPFGYWFRNLKKNGMCPESDEEELEMKDVPYGQNALGSLMRAMICSRHGLRVQRNYHG